MACLKTPRKTLLRRSKVSGAHCRLSFSPLAQSHRNMLCSSISNFQVGAFPPNASVCASRWFSKTKAYELEAGFVSHPLWKAFVGHGFLANASRGIWVSTLNINTQHAAHLYTLDLRFSGNCTGLVTIHPKLQAPVFVVDVVVVVVVGGGGCWWWLLLLLKKQTLKRKHICICNTLVTIEFCTERWQDPNQSVYHLTLSA